MLDDKLHRAAMIIKSIRYVSLATVCEDGRPWNSPVAHEYDNELNLYWFSDKEGQHSLNVRSNGKVFAVIYDSTVPEGDGEGVFFEADVVELSDPEEILFARKIKHGWGFQHNAGAFLGTSVRRVYKATPKHIWINDAEITNGVFVRDFKVELPIDELKKLIHRDIGAEA